MRLLSLLVLVLAVTGCAPMLFVRPGATAQDFDAEHFQCRMQVTTAYGGMQQMDLATVYMVRKEIQTCLRSKGWREQSSLDKGAGEPTAITAIPPCTPSTPNGTVCYR